MESVYQVKTKPKKVKEKEKVESKKESDKQKEIIQGIDSELKTEDNKEKDDKTEGNKEKQDDKADEKTKDNIEKQDDISNSSKIQSSIKTYYEIYDIFKNATYKNEDYWTIAKIPTKNEENCTNTTSLTIDIYKEALVGKIKEIDEKEQIQNKISDDDDDVDKYDIIFFLIKYLRYISLLNYKLTNKINLNDVEKNVIKNLINQENNNNIVLYETKSESDTKNIKNFDCDYENFTIPKIFYDDIEKIKRKEITDLDDQIKFDIYNQMKKNKNQTKYEKELDVAYRYLISEYYNEISLNISLKNDGRECVEEKVVQKQKISTKRSLVYC